MIGGTANFHETVEDWIDNPDGPRTMAQARIIAENNGAPIEDDMHFIPVPDAWFDENFGNAYAIYGRLSAHRANELILWKSKSGHSFLDPDDKINIWVRESVLRSDRAITAVLAHEAYEIEALRLEFAKNGGGLHVRRYEDLIKVNVPGNFHWKAAGFGDELVRKMIEQGK